MVRDEFNNVEVTNEKQLLKVEFGKTQSAEFTSKKENTVPEGDLNEKYVGKTIKKETEINVDYINKVPTHATQTVVTSSTTATTAAAATATTAVAASTVAVVAIATATGISVALHDYHFDFESFIISSNELRYVLTVFDKNDDKTYLEYESYDYEEPYLEGEEYDPMKEAPFLLRVTNREYNVAQPVFYHSYNEGIFEDLVLGETYKITLTENRYGGETIYSESFTTYSNTEFNSFSLSGTSDLEDGYFEVEMRFVDEEERFSNFELCLFDPEMPEEINHVFSLEKISGTQYVYVTNEDNEWILDLTREWGYEFSYLDGEETVNYASGTVIFNDWLGRESMFREFVFTKEANFIENSFDVQLDYQDDFAWYSDFNLKLTQIPVDDDQTAGGQSGEEQYYSVDIPLASTSEVQTINLNEYEMFVRESYFKYTYSLSCVYRGDTMVLSEEATPFSFTDTSGAKTEFKAFEFSKEANFLDNTFKVRLDYVDDFEALYSFTLHLFPNGVNAQYDFYLDKTTDEQTCTFNENDHWNFSFDYEYTYTLTYYNDGEEVTLNENGELFKFTDISGGVSEFRGVTFTGNYVMSTGLAPVQLDYQDDFNYLSNFVLHVFGPITNQGNGDGNDPLRAGGNSGISIDDYPYVFALEKTTEVQYINLYNSEIPTSAEGKYLYALTYSYRGEEQEPIEGDKQIEFVDPDAESVVNGINFLPNNEQPEANFETRQFQVQLDYQDDYGYFSNFTLQVRDNLNGGWVERELENTTEPQTVTIDDYDYDEGYYPVDIVEGELTYNFTYVSSETGDPATQYFFSEEPSLVFENSLKSEFYGLETSYDFTQTDTGEYRLPFRFDCVNDAEYLSVPELYFTPVDNTEEILATISFANETMTSNWQYGSFSPYPGSDFTIEDLTNGDEYNVVVACYEKDGYNGSEQRNIKYCEPHVLTLNQKQEIHSVGVDRYILAGSWEIYTTVFANGDISSFSNCQFIVESEDGEITLIYDIEEIGEYNTISLMSPKNRTVTEQLLMDVFSNPVNITFKYSKPGSDDIITVNCYSNCLFWISNQLTN